MRAAQLIEQGDYIEALQELDPYLQENPNCPKGLFLFGQIMLATDKAAIAYLIYKKVSEMEPKKTEVWCNLGKAAGDLNLFDEEEKYFRKALKIDPNNTIAMKNLAANGVHKHNPDQAIHWAKKCLSYGEDADARHNLGFAKLLKHDWSGWADYEAGLGTVPSREEKNYRGEPRWDGMPGSIIVYGEQGLGDQIAFAAPLNDAQHDADGIILDVHKKLKGLFRRSFGFDTYGTYRDADIDWHHAYHIDANCSLASLQKFYRYKDEQFTGKPFLIPDLNRVTGYKAILDSISDKPKIGIAWTGGTAQTQSGDRSADLETFLPILSDKVEWISLEYRDKSDEIRQLETKHGIIIHDLPYATQTEDYDDTAALVANLDLVISVPTSVVHLAGGLGVECWCITPKHPSFMFGMEGRTMPFYQSVELFRRNKGWDVLQEVKERLDKWIAQ